MLNVMVRKIWFVGPTAEWLQTAFTNSSTVRFAERIRLHKVPLATSL
jgi:hypothetical protein